MGQWYLHRYRSAFCIFTTVASCQLCTDLVTHMLHKRHIWSMNYLDDFIGASLPVHANSQFFYLRMFLRIGTPHQ